jgi:hypothetical protein
MKKLLILSILVAGACQLKAQQLTIKPSDPLLFKTPKGLDLQKFKLSDSALFKYQDLSKLPKLEQLADLQGINSPDKNAELFYSRMPVAKLYSNDKMPVVNTDDSIDKMPVKRFKTVDPLGKLQVIPGTNP